MKRIAFYTLLLFVFGCYNSVAQSVKVTPSVICKGSLATICVDYTPASGLFIIGYKFDLFNNGTTIVSTPATQKCYSYLYNPGIYTVKVTVLLSNSTTVDLPLTTITVYYLPLVDFSLTSEDTQCYRGNDFCFKNLSKQNPNSPSNPLRIYYWNYGDASGDSTLNASGPCHKYYLPFDKTTALDVMLSVADTKGCHAETSFKNFITIRPNIYPNFKWTFLSGPCFSTCYLFKNVGVAPANQIQQYSWDFGDGSTYTGSGLNDPDLHYDTITHCYLKDGQFLPAFRVTDIYGCTDSVRKTEYTTVQPLPQNINIKFDIQTSNPSFINYNKDTVCVGSGNSKRICFSNTPVNFAMNGSGDFVWDFGDENNSLFLNKDSLSWNACHEYSGVGNYFPKLTIKNICPDTTFQYFSTVSTYSRLDSSAYADNDWGNNPVTQTNQQTLPYQFSNPLPTEEYITLYNTRSKRILPQLSESGVSDLNVYAYANKQRDMVVYFRRLFPIIKVNGLDTTLFDSIKIQKNHLLKFNLVPGASKALYHRFNLATTSYDSVYAYVMDLPRPQFLFKKSILITDSTTGNIIQPVAYIYYQLLNSFKMSGYGIEVLGPNARIELPELPITIKSSQKYQCGPTDTVDFVNASSYYKSRKVWRRWDFDDDFAPQCTSFSVPRNGFPRPGKHGEIAWNTAMDQDFGSDHYFIANGKIYPGRMSCKFSFDTLPRYNYPNWDSVYQWFRFGHDFMPWDYSKWDTVSSSKFLVRASDKKWWGKAIYLNIGTGEWSLIPGTTLMQHQVKSYAYKDPITGSIALRYYVDTISGGSSVLVNWPRIDTMNLRTNGGQDITPNAKIYLYNVPDPIGLSRGKYVLLNGPLIDPSGPSFQVKSGNDSWTISPTTVIPGGGDFYEYVFKKVIQRCYNVKLKLIDSLNNESGVPISSIDSMVLDKDDCWDESSVQLSLSKPDARGLGVSGKLCPGLSYNGFGANIRFNLGASNQYPGVSPSCGQTFILFNYDSLADRKDNTPCELDGFVGWQGGNTPGGNTWPPMFSGTDFNPLTIWTSPNRNSFVYHYGYNSGTPPPADTLNGWVTVGLKIGNGCKDSLRKNILMSQYRANLILYQSEMGDYQFNKLINYRSLLPGIPDTLVDIEYLNCNVPRCESTPIWYHNFIRLINLDASFTEFPYQDPINKWKLRGKGETITVYYNDSIQDSIRYNMWIWGDGTCTVDSFWYAGDATLNDGFYTNGLRRVRYNWDMFKSTLADIDSSFFYSKPELIDSTVWPIRASFPGATDGLKPRTPGKFQTVYFNTTNYCTGGNNPNPSSMVVDTAMMLLPISHKYVRTSWEADNRMELYKGPDANISPMIHVLVSTGGCQKIDGKYITIGIIDTFETRNAYGQADTIFCTNEPVYFYDSIRYWRYDASVSSLPFNPGGTRNPTMNNYKFVEFNYPENLLQIDTFNFWRYREFDPFDFKGQIYHDTLKTWNPTKGKYDITIVSDSVLTERVYWDFGDGTWPYFQGTNPIHFYSSGGKYKVTMFSIDSMGNIDTCMRYITISKPVAKIGLTKETYNCGIPAIPFFDSSYIVPASDSMDKLIVQYWWFGDNKADTINPFSPATGNPNPQYPYGSNGLFKIKLVVTTEHGCTDTTRRSIRINGPRPEFKVIGDTLGCSPFKVNILNLSDDRDKQNLADTPTRVVHVFWGDGAQDTIMGSHTIKSHIYNNSGIYSISILGSDVNPWTGLGNCPLVLFPDTLHFSNPIHIYALDQSVGKIQGKSSGKVNDTATYFVNPYPGFTYTWSVTGGTIQSQIGSNIIVKWPAQIGVYKVKVKTDNSSCGATDSMLVNVTLTDVKELPGVQHILLYPNPATNQLNLSFESNHDQNIQMKMYDVLGNLVLKDNIEHAIGKTKRNYSLETLSEGVYMVHVISNEQEALWRIVITR